MKLTLLFLALALITVLPCTSWAWDYIYDGSVLPDDLSLGSNGWVSAGDLSMCSTDGSALHVVDGDASNGVGFSRSSAPANSSFTVEARVRVAGGDGTVLYSGTPSYTPYLRMCSDRVVVRIGYDTATYTADLSSFRTIRMATEVHGDSYTTYVWLDQSLLAQGTSKPGGNSDTVMFGAPWSGTGESYWDYVAYSNSFIPVPEPASLLALCAGLVPLMFRRRRG